MTWIKTALKSVAFIAFVSVGFAVHTLAGIAALLVSYVVASIWEAHA
jgi:hypothetical protein